MKVRGDEPRDARFGRRRMGHGRSVRCRAGRCAVSVRARPVVSLPDATRRSRGDGTTGRGPESSLANARRSCARRRRTALGGDVSVSMDRPGLAQRRPWRTADPSRAGFENASGPPTLVRITGINGPIGVAFDVAVVFARRFRHRSSRSQIACTRRLSHPTDRGRTLQCAGHGCSARRRVAFRSVSQVPRIPAENVRKHPMADGHY